MSYLLPDGMRERLRTPMGEIMQEPDWEGEFITVGDECSYLAAKASKEPLLAIYDGRIQRKEVCEGKAKAIDGLPGKKLIVDNPPKMVTTEAEMAIRLGLEYSPAKIQVRGEEDLLVLPCMIYAKEGTAIYYGQPNEGVVKVMVNPEARERAKEILLSMKEVK